MAQPGELICLAGEIIDPTGELAWSAGRLDGVFGGDTKAGQGNLADF